MTIDAPVLNFLNLNSAEIKSIGPAKFTDNCESIIERFSMWFGTSFVEPATMHNASTGLNSFASAKTSSV